VIMSSDSVARFPIGAMRDGRIVQSGDGLLAVLTEPTERYAHGVLGDTIEAAAITVFDPAAGSVVAEVEVEPPAVIEGLSAIWADIDGDNEDDLLVTISDPSSGARLAVFSAGGDLLAEGPPIGRGSRWRSSGRAPVESRAAANRG